MSDTCAVSQLTGFWIAQNSSFIVQDGRVNVFYSTPSIYLDAKYEANETWPLKTDDFFP